MMKTPIHRLLPAALLMLAATACEDTLTAPDAPGANGDGLTLTLVLDNSEDNSNTRSTLENGAPVNHVQTVRILVFKGGTEDQNYTDATYVGEEIYTGDNTGAIAWSDAAEGQEKPDKITYRMNYPFVEDETYTLLGVGQDDMFAKTYDIEPTENTTLANAYAKLKSDEGKGKGDIAQCDFYTGTTTFTHAGKNTHIDDLLMKRRVAGVMLYVTEIPQSLTDENNDNYRVTSIKVCLPDKAKQNSSVLLRRDFENWDEEPAGQTPLTGEDDNVVAEITGLDNPVANGGLTYTDGNDFYMTNGKPATKRTGVYMLPLNATDGAPTFTVKLYGKQLDPAQTGGATVTGAEEIELKSLTVEQRNADGESVTDFPILSNYLYSIGKYNPTEGVDEPISLSGSPIYLEVLPFTELEDNNPTFESARVQAVFDHSPELNPIHNCMNEEFQIRILPPVTTVRDFVKSINLTITHDNTYALNDSGKEGLIIEDETLDEDRKAYFKEWLYVKTQDVPSNPAQNTYDNTYILYNKEQSDANNPDANNIDDPWEVTLFIEDYARFRQWGWSEEGEQDTDSDSEWAEKINKDIRHNTILLTTYFTEESGMDERTDTLTIKQYNTITVCYKGWGNETEVTKCGFSREDVKGDDGEPIICEWKFYQYKSGVKIINSTIYDDSKGSLTDGAANVDGLGYFIYDDTNSSFAYQWNESASQKAHHTFKKVDTAPGTWTYTPPITSKSTQTFNTWYLPAQYELEGFMKMAANRTNGIINTNVPMGKESEEEYYYWSSTIGNENDEAFAYGYSLENDGNISYVWDNKKRNTALRIRSARKFSEYYPEDSGW